MHTQSLPVFPVAMPAVLHLGKEPVPAPARGLAGKTGQAGSKVLPPGDLVLRPSLEAGECLNATPQQLE